MNKKLVLATVATIAAVGTATGVYADETNVQGTVTAGDNTSTVTTAGTGRIGKEKMKQRKLINNQLLKIQMQKQEARATIQNNRELLRMTMTFK